VKVFVTGSTGLLGSNLVRALVAAGHEVVALARSRAKAEKFLGNLPGVTFIEGDMEKMEAFAPKLQGCDVLFHTAAYFREYYLGAGDHWATLERLNVQGTVRLLELAEKAGVKKTIYVSSSTVIGKSPNGQVSDEGTPPDAFSYRNLYAKSKVLAEEAVIRFTKTHTMPVVLILPTWMWGPGDAAPTGAGQIIISFVTGKLPVVAPGGSMMVDARDVAQAMLAAVEHGKNGERYIIGGCSYTFAEVMIILEKITGKRAPRMRVPGAAFVNFARFSEFMARLRNRSTLVTVEAAETMVHHALVKSDKAQRDLGATFRPFEQTLHDHVKWMQEYGMIPR
jgi:dihydroflavonol-4-reductase